MNEAVDIVFSYGFSDTLCSLYMDIFKVEVLRGVVSANKVVNHVGMSYTLFE